jgi:hypothetical protein
MQTLLMKMQCAALANFVTADACGPVVSGEPGFASGILAWKSRSEINGRDEAVSFQKPGARNGSRTVVRHAKSEPVEGAKIDGGSQ